MSKNILCTWCKLVLNSTDKIYSTGCGHIFHFNCMRSCQSRSTSCPECSYINPPTHEMFLFFEKSNDENVATNWNEKLKIIELHKEIEDNKTNFIHLQEKYSVLQDLVRKLEEKNRICNNGILQRTAIISDLEDRINDLEEHNQFLTIDNECKQESLTLKSKQITELKSLWLNREKGTANTNLSKETKTFESKFKNQSADLEQQLQRSVGETKLQDHVNVSQWDSSGIKGTMTPNFRENFNKNAACTDGSSKPYKNEPDKVCLSHYTKEDYSITSISENGMDKSLFIKNFPKNKLIYPLKKVIVTFVATKQGYISEDDITDVYVKDGHGKSYFQLPTNITLFVQFNNRDLKLKFLLNRAQIQQTIPTLELIEIKEDVKGTAESNSESMKQNSRDNITTKWACTDGLLTPYQNEPDKLCLSNDTKENNSVPSISECSIMNSDNLNQTHTKDNINVSTDNSLLIKNFPKKDLIHPLKIVILTFAVTKQGYISEDDIVDVYVKDGNGKSFSQLPDYVTLFVRFTNRDLKLKFLLNRVQILQTSPTLELIEISDDIKGTSKSYKDGETLKPNSNDNITTKVACTEERSITSDSLIRTHPNDNINLAIGNSLLIKNYPKNELEYPLKIVILKFVATKEGYISEDDITDVYVKDGNRLNYFQLPNFVTLFVQFKNRYLKHKFLLNRAQILETSPTLELIEINDDIKGTTNSYSDGVTFKPNSRDNITTKLACTDGILSPYEPDKLCLSRDKKENYSVPSTSERSTNNDSLNRTHSNDDINTSTGNSLLIKNIFKNNLEYPLKNVILKFVATKEGYISENDITKVYVKNGYRKSFSQLPMNVTLFVQFKNQYLKTKFLLNRAHIQKTSPSIELMDIDKNNDGINEMVTSSSKTMKPNSTENTNKKVPVTDGRLKSSISECSKNSDNINSTTGNSIFIKNFPKKDLIYPLKNVILTFVAIKEGYISEDDITKVNIKDGRGRKNSELPMKVTLFVQFKNEHLKKKFLLNRAQIQQASPSIELIEIVQRNDGIKGKDNTYNDGRTKKPNSRENKKVSVTDGSIKSYLNEADKLGLSHDIDYYAISIPGSDSVNRTHPKDNVNSSTGNNILIKDVPKNAPRYPLKKELFETNNDGMKGTDKSYSDEMKPNSTDNVNTKVASTTDGAVKPSENVPDKLCLSNDTNDVYSVISITDFLMDNDSVFQTHPKDNINSSNDNKSLTKDFPKNELKFPLNKELIQTNKYNESIKGTDKRSVGKTMKTNSRENISTKVGRTTNGSVKPDQNVPDNLYLSHDTKDATSISECSMGSDSIIGTHSKDKLKPSPGYSLLIKNVPKKDLIYPLKQFILTFVATREGCISEDDITKVHIKDGRGKNKSQLPMKVTLFVQFKNQDLKAKFLLNRVQIQQKSPLIELIETDTHNDDTNEDLLKYAIQKLSGKGFSFFFRQNDEVMALKTRSDSEGIRILDKSHVNNLLKSQKKN